MSPPVPPRSLASITLPRGFTAAGGICGIKASGKPDLAVIAADRPVPAAGVFTKNKIKGEPVKVAMRHLRGGHLRAIVVNSGCSNVATGKPGERDAVEMCRIAAEHLGCQTRQVVPCSTGVIGRPLPMDKVGPGIGQVIAKLSRGKQPDSDAATAILTTDLVPKVAKTTITLGGKKVTLGGICKGSGMIAPNMATMLAFITTDANITPALLKSSLRAAVNASFNRVTVDTDTSTSDSVIVMASGAAEHRIIAARGKQYDTFVAGLTEVCQQLAYQLVRDGEGANKVFRVNVIGGKSEKDADKAGRAVAESPLVKTAVHGGDPNWGRLAMAVGKSGARFDPGRLKLSIAGTAVYKQGLPINMTPAVTAKLEKAMAKEQIDIGIDLGAGEAEVVWMGCDLSREYIAINADYTT